MKNITGPIRVLLVDDQSQIRKGLEMRLALERDIEVVGQAEDGIQALEAVQKLHPEVVVMDYVMPKMDGIQAAEVITKNYTGVAVIILSIDDSPRLLSETIQAGASALVAKRKGTDKLLSEIRRAVAEVRSRG
jgi:DNA-binding NarL/FixJ family response regulator